MIGFWWSRQYLAGQPCEVAEQGNSNYPLRLGGRTHTRVLHSTMTGRHTASQAGRTPAGRLTVRARLGRSAQSASGVHDCPLWLDSGRRADCTGPVQLGRPAQLVRRTAPANTATLGNVDSVCGGTA
eukprot:gene18843-biopygen16004